MSGNTAVVANFGEDLRFSGRLSDEPAWIEFYRRVFPDLTAAVRVDGKCRMQQDGIDRILVFANGMEQYVDEKKRRDHYTDVLIELFSDLDRRKGGWTVCENKRCDYIAYAIPKAKRCYLMPFPLLRQATLLNWREWAKATADKNNANAEGFIDVPNRSWMTRNIPVPWPVIRDALTQQMHRKYAGDIVLPLPKPVSRETDRRQMTFSYSWDNATVPNEAMAQG